MKKNLTIFTLLFVIIGGITLYFRYNVISINPINENATTTLATSTIVEGENISTSTTMKVKIALLGTQMETSNKNNFRGCDVFELVERDVPTSSMPLNAALRELFSKKYIWMSGETTLGNFIASQKELFFDKADIQNGVAKIYLIGKIGPLSGVCDDPRLRIQLEETALQYPSIQTVEFYLNGIKNDFIFSQKGN
jgi:hypothetical protein